MIRRVYTALGMTALFVLGGDRRMKRFVQQALDSQRPLPYAESPDRPRRFKL